MTMNDLQKRALKRLDDLIGEAAQKLAEEQHFKADVTTKSGQALLAIYEAQSWVSALQHSLESERV